MATGPISHPDVAPPLSEIGALLATWRQLSSLIRT